MNPPLSLKWSVNLSSMVSYPIIIGDRVFVAAGNNLMALDAETGDVLWSQSTPSGFETWSGPAYDNGLLFAAPAFSESENGMMCAFSPTDGHQVWCTQLPGQYTFGSAPTALNGIVYVSADQVLYAVRESDGSLLWHVSPLADVDPNPTVTDDGVYVAGFCSASKFQTDNGAIVWSESWQCEPAPSTTSPAYDGLLWAPNTSGPGNHGTILNLANGSVVGTFTTEGTPGFWQNSAVYLFTNMIVSYDISTGLPQWLALPDEGDAFICPPIGVNGVIYTSTKQGKVYGYLSTDGSKVFGKDTGGGTNYCWDDNEPVIGLSAGEGLLLVPVTHQLFAYKFDNFGKWQFVPTPPCRLLDTRQTHNPIQGGTSQDFDVPQLGGCNIPSTATAYSLNVTVAPHGSLGYLTIWPTMEAQPTVSTMNSPDGRVKANAAIVPAGYDDNISVYASDTTDVILDINGYFTPAASGTLQFYPMTPCRVVDTRNANGPLGGPRLAANGTRDFPIESSSCIPSGVNPQAYAFNVTAVPNPTGQPLGYLTVWPAGQSQPTVSTLNNYTATVVANAAVVPAGTGGDIDVYSSDTTDLVIDIDGYFAAPGQGGLSLYPTTPCRALDTRSGHGAFSGELTVNMAGSLCSPPSTAQAYLLNATVIPTGPLNYLTLWPDGQQQPTASTLNAWDGETTSNMAIVPTTNGSIDAYAAGGVTQLLLDISGYFAP